MALRAPTTAGTFIWATDLQPHFYWDGMEWSAKQSQTGKPLVVGLTISRTLSFNRKIGEHPFQGTISRTDATGTGRSVGERVNQRVLVCTRRLLDSRNTTIAEIAFAAGFRDISHFNRLFKRSNGASPRQFRRTVTSSAG
jgi:hypothetical protein